ncbi:MAG: glucuronyl hydrolase [Thalassobius sp.]|nr:glucuronyl hydrolase [Thalassovita sp.]
MKKPFENKPANFLIFLFVSLYLFSCSQKNTETVSSEDAQLEKKSLTGKSELNNLPTVIAEQLLLADKNYPELDKYPRSVENGETILVGIKDWTSGFYPGSLWYTYDLTKDDKVLAAAKARTAPLEPLKDATHTHDLGFMLYCSFGNALNIGGDESAKPILLQGAKSLISRYSETVGCIKSWDWSKEWKYPVIIDNMMNLELLFWATKESGDSTFYKIAEQHALTTLRNHFREDGSTWHVVDYDPESGDVLEKVTHQGYADSSSWARGQAWAIYGYTVAFRETKKEVFLEQAEQTTDFYLNHPNQPEDLVAYWDFNDPSIPDVSRDASAAAIVSSALFELANYVDADKGQLYKEKATAILESLASDEYLAKPGENNYFLLKHATGNLPANSEIDEPLNYADYYFIEALRRYLGKDAITSM